MELVIFDEALAYSYPDIQITVLAYIQNLSPDMYTLFVDTAKISQSVQKSCQFLMLCQEEVSKTHWYSTIVYIYLGWEHDSLLAYINFYLSCKTIYRHPDRKMLLVDPKTYPIIWGHKPFCNGMKKALSLFVWEIFMYIIINL